jgi:chromate transporter
MNEPTPPRFGAQKVPSGTWLEVFAAFLCLGLTSFGGPIAHLGYFREAFVVRRRWLTDETYADLIALCQFLPGPASSQVGVAIGLSRASYPGALAAWLGFTMPSAIAMVLFAYGAAAVGDTAGTGWLHGLKIAAVAVVAIAVLRMMRTLAPDRERATITALVAILLLAVPSSLAQVLVIALGGIAGALVLPADAPRAHAALPLKVSRLAGSLSLALFFALLIGALGA